MGFELFISLCLSHVSRAQFRSNSQVTSRYPASYQARLRFAHKNKNLKVSDFLLRLYSFTCYTEHIT
jgi:hypothetical protein